MSVIAEFTVPAEAFALWQTFEAVPDVTVEVERLATHSREWVMPFVWVSSGDIDAAEDALRTDPCIAELQAMDAGEAVREFNVEWSEGVQQLVDQIVDQHGIVQEAEAVDGTWYLNLKFVDRDAVGDFQAYFDDQNSDFELQRIYDGTPPRERDYDLTPEQREVLVTALASGYFAVPRKAKSSDLAEELGISTNAISQRLRRATGNLTRSTLEVASTGEPGDEADDEE